MAHSVPETRWSLVRADPAEAGPAIEVIGVSRAFPGSSGPPALDSVSLSIASGDYVCVVGPSGSGKSTLLNILGLLDRPTQGRVLMDGVDVSELREIERTSLRGRRIGFVFQDFHLLPHRSVLQNVMLGSLYTGVEYSARVADALQMIERVGLSHRTNSAAGTLSGGERQRTAIARALVAKPRLLLCDEPTGNLDSVTSGIILDLLESIGAEGVTVVMITHDATIAAAAARTITVRDGGVVSDLRNAAPPVTSGAPARSIEVARRSGVRIRDVFFEALAGLSQRMPRTVFTMLGATIGIGAVVTVLGLNSTAAAQIRSSFSLTRATEVTVSDAGGSSEKETVYSFPNDSEDAVLRLEGVHEAGIAWQLPTSGAVSVATSLHPAAPNARLLAYAASPGYLRTLAPTVTSGRLFGAFEEQQRLPVAVIGAGAARDLNIASAHNAPTIFIRGSAYTVIGIIGDVATDSAALAAVYLPASSALARFGEPQVEAPAHMRVVTRVGAAQVVADQVAVALRPDRPELLKVVPPAAPFALETRVSTAMQSLLLAVAGVILLIGTTGIASTNLVAVSERIPEIGLRRAVGGRPRDIQHQILAETSILGLFGGLVGSAAAVVAIVVTSIALSWTAVVDPMVALLGPVLGAVIGALAGLYPAARAAAIEPIAALRR